MNDFQQAVELGSTGLRVSRLGLGSSFGIGASTLEEAFDLGVNYFYWGSVRRPAFGLGMRRLARRAREKIVLTVQSYSQLPGLIEPSVDVALLRSGVEYFDILLLGMRNQEPAASYLEAFERMRERGKVRFLALSTHNRPLLQDLFAQESAERSGYDVFMLRYNAVHRGAEQDVFPYVPAAKKPGIIAYTATRWGHLLDPRKMPEGETPLEASDCYRFALSHPAVDLVLCGPANREEMREGVRALERGPLSEEELGRIRRIGDHISGRYRPRSQDLGDASRVA